DLVPAISTALIDTAVGLVICAAAIGISNYLTRRLESLDVSLRAAWLDLAGLVTATPALQMGTALAAGPLTNPSVPRPGPSAPITDVTKSPEPSPDAPPPPREFVFALRGDRARGRFVEARSDFDLVFDHTFANPADLQRVQGRALADAV